LSTVQLTKPIQAHGAEVSEIEMREPNGGDIAACGYPFRFITGDDGGMQVLPEAKAIAAMISRLGNIPLGSVGQLSLGDWQACMSAVLSFFGEQAQISSNAALISPGSGNGTRSSP
jgi:Phage tail assembly chaperone proteins, E, or 41 or 14